MKKSNKIPSLSLMGGKHSEREVGEPERERFLVVRIQTTM